MKYDFLVLGADGMQGLIVTRDLLEKQYSVFASDLYKVRIGELLRGHKNAAFAVCDLRDFGATVHLIQKARPRVVINCAEGDWNLNVYQACLQTGKHVIDLGSQVEMTRMQLNMNAAFRKAGLTAITGCGSVPGIGNVMLAHAARKVDSLQTVNVGFAWDSNIKRFVPPFSIESILEEFTVPAPYIVNGYWRKKLPSESRSMRYSRAIGYQENFLAVHAETYSFQHYYKRKGLKNVKFFAGFPEHSVKTIRTLIELGFANLKPIRFEGANIVPAQFLAQMLKRMKTPRGYREWENLWVEVIGRKGRHRRTILMECIVPTLPDWEDAGCNIDTALPAVIIAEMIYDGTIDDRGSFAPEAVVPEKSFFKALKKRKMQVFEDGVPVH
jgi:saccharopine dehydrogenase-like NADP-dependent oxidoreductase